MKFLRDTTWEEVFEGWRQREANDPGWIHCATQIKGWPNWESWRNFTASQLGAPSLSWKLFEFTDPMNEIPAMLIGPYTGWQDRIANKNHTTFEELLEDSKQFEFFSKHSKVVSMMEDFPDVDIIGLIREDLNKVVDIEGHHRATTVALAKKQGRQINFKNNPRIALAQLPTSQIHILDEVLKRGSTKNPII